MNNNADMITQSINVYTKIFSSYFNPFLNWGERLFYSFSIIAVVWLCLWRAFDKDSVSEALPGFLKEFFTVAFFYTIMIHAAPWLSSIVDSAQAMGDQLTRQKIDPASIIQQGVTIANKIFSPVRNSGVTDLGLGTVIIAAAYLLTLFSFIFVALNLAVTLLMTTFFISLSGFLLAFGAFTFTRSIARRALDIVIAYSMKLLTLYLAIDAGSGILTVIAGYLPADKITTFDVYTWTITAVLLFWCVATVLPKQAAELFRNMIEESKESDVHSRSSFQIAAAPAVAAPPFSTLQSVSTLHTPDVPVIKSKPFRGES